MVRKLKSPAHAVYAAWTEPRLIAKWLAPGADTVTSVTVDLRKGGRFRLDGLNGDGKPYSFCGTYLELAENRRVALSWMYDGPVPALRADASVVVVDIQKLEPDLTELTLTHEKLTGRDEAEIYRVSWTECMSKLESAATAHKFVSPLDDDSRRADFYSDSHRRMQDRFATRKLADRLEAVLIHDHLSAVDAAFITRQNMVFVATSDAYGQPNCSYKGGTRGFVAVVDERTLAFPDYNGNGMHLSMGNIDETSKIALLFVDFERQARMRVMGSASVSVDDPLRERYPGAQQIVRIAIESVFTNCPRYVHKMKLLEESTFVPNADAKTPDPAWKRLSAVADVLPEEDKHLAGKDTDLDKTLNKD
ncbi:SRPBCC domain-containing protein [uncultured Hyphomicrobium sp.]|uniref:SRPBCC domain-containing protein n=1 Tax=uncultured Hyphomicrobium sp. TaxID=194373 RepID=UPI0025CCDF9F|nr:SRPBCC domain-containing protein [uncultured Hyphomicrobium sp.]